MSDRPATPPVEEAPRATHRCDDREALLQAAAVIQAEADTEPDGPDTAVWARGMERAVKVLRMRADDLAAARPVSGDTEGLADSKDAYVTAWLRQSLRSDATATHQDREDWSVIAMHVSRVVEERDRLRAVVQPLLDQAAKDRAAVEAVESLLDVSLGYLDPRAAACVRDALASTTERSDDEAPR